MTELNILKRHEGFMAHIYQCSGGKNTIGYGFNLDAGIDEELATVILNHQYSVVKRECSRNFPWYSTLDRVRRFVIENMVFNMGLTRFQTFQRTIEAVRTGQYSVAAEEMLDSKWAKQVGARADELAKMMKTGKF